MDNIANSVINLAEKHLGTFKIRNGQIIPQFCPFCKGGKNGDKETFAVGLYNGAWNCQRGSCEGVDGKGKVREGSFKELCEYFGQVDYSYANLPRSIGQRKRTYDKPDPNMLKERTDEIVTYFGKRKISEQTLMDFNIAADEKGNIVFPFYRNEELVYVKFRKPRKHTKEDGPKEWQLSNTESILFGMDMVSFNKPLVICEGEIDALSIYEAGVTNVVSVPCGCTNMDWINNCYDWLENFQQIILFGDSDEPGIEMTMTLMKRLGEDRCMIPKDYPPFIVGEKDYGRPCKDANEILFAYGPDGLKQFLDQCEPAPVKGILNLADVPFVDPTTQPRIMTGIPALDNMIGGLGEGSVSILSGKRGEGKSTIGGEIMLNAIKQGYPVAAYSGELSAYKFLEWIMLQATENKYIAYKTDMRSGKNICYVEPTIQQRIKDWISGKFYLFDNGYISDDNMQDSILKCFEVCAKRYGCKLFLVDNLMSALISPDEENKAQARFTSAMKAFASKYKVSVLIVAHPRKEKADQTFTNDSVSGSSVITNLADCVLSIEKPNIRVTKNRDFGTTGLIQCGFDPTNRRIFQLSYGDMMVFPWDHTGIKIPENQAITLPEFALQQKETSCPF